MRFILYLLIAVFAVRSLPLNAQTPIPPPMEEFDEDEDEDEDDDDIEEPPAMRPPPMPTPFNQGNPNAGGVPGGMPGNTRPGAPVDSPFNNFRPPGGGGAPMGSAVGTMMANPTKMKFKVVEGEYYVKGKKRGRDPVRK